MERAILHVDMDAFYASVEQRDDPRLRGKPVIVGGPSRRGVVAAASYEVRRFGVRSAMSMVEALQRCPDAIVVPVRMARYQAVSAEVFEVFRRYTPLVEGLSLDEAFLDVTGSRRLFGDEVQIARRIKAEIREATGLTASAGVAPSKFVAKVASDLVTIVDDPLLPRAPGSRPFDGEGLLSRRNTVVEKGELKTYLLDSYAARKLEMESTASASRGASGGVGPSTTNFVLQPGELSREALLADTKKGLYVTEMMGFGFNAVTGDFSRGASGFLIEDGELTKPVSEVTISLNVDQLFQRIDAVADDLDLRTSTASPTFRVAKMTIAGR